MRPPQRPRARHDRGDALVVFCVGMVLLILPLGGVSLDLWHAISEERGLQAAADAAAAAGAGAINTTAYRIDPYHPVLYAPQAVQDAATSLKIQHGLPALSQRPDITATSDTVTVQLHEHVHLTLLRLLLGNRSIEITATSSASPRASGQP